MILKDFAEIQERNVILASEGGILVTVAQRDPKTGGYSAHYYVIVYGTLIMRRDKPYDEYVPREEYLNNNKKEEKKEDKEKKEDEKENAKKKKFIPGYEIIQKLSYGKAAAGETDENDDKDLPEDKRFIAVWLQGRPEVLEKLVAKYKIDVRVPKKKKQNAIFTLRD